MNICKPCSRNPEGFAMRKILIPLFVLFCFALVAQPHVLPSLEIRSEGTLLAPFPKKPVTFPEEIAPDSLMSQVPPVFSLRHKLPKPKPGTVHPLRLDFDMDTSVRSSLSFSHRPQNRFVSLWRLDGDFAVPATDFYRSSLALGINTRTGELLPSFYQFAFQRSQTASFTGETYSFSTQEHFDSIDLGALDFQDLRTRFSLEKAYQNLDEESSSHFAFGFDHSHILRFEKQRMANRLMVQERQVGLALQYRAPWFSKELSRFDLGLMTDFHHILPALDINKRMIFSKGRYLELGNKSEIKALSRYEIAETHPWVYLPARPRLEMKPIDLYFRGWKLWDGTLLHHAGLGQNLRFFYNQPDVYAPDSQALLRQASVFDWEVSGEALLNYKGCQIRQDLALDFQWLKDGAWVSRAYTPRWKAKTQASYTLKELDLWASLEQQWFSEDENGNLLPNVFDLSLGLSLPVFQDLRLSLSLDNLFNTVHPAPGTLPKPGRSLRLGLSWLPLK